AGPAAGADRALLDMAGAPAPSGRPSARAAAAPGLTLTAPAAQAAPSAAGRTPTATPDRPSLVPGAAPRGAFLLPRVARELLAQGAPGTAAPSVQPLELAALDVMAAGAVAGVDSSPQAPIGAARTASSRRIPV